MDDLKNLPYAEWLELSLRNFISMRVESICICTKFESGEVGTGYWNASMGDKVLFAGIIQQDAILDTLHENGLIPDEDDEDIEEEYNG